MKLYVTYLKESKIFSRLSELSGICDDNCIYATKDFINVCTYMNVLRPVKWILMIKDNPAIILVS